MNIVINMIKFFRKIRKKLLGEGKLSKYFLYAIGEIVLVVIGILIALQINNLNELKKQKRLTNSYLVNLELDLKSDLIALDSASVNLDFFEKEGYYSLEVLEGKIEKIDTTKFLKSLIWNNHFHMYQPTRSTYDDLIGSGNIKLIINNDLKVTLSKYYTKDDWMSQFSLRAKDTYWYVMREEMFRSVDPNMMGAFFDSSYADIDEYPVGFEDIFVDFEKVKTHDSLKDAIKRALALRIWHRKEQRRHKLEIEKIIKMLNVTSYE